MIRKNKTARTDHNRKKSFGYRIYRMVMVAFIGVVTYVLFFSGLLSVTSISVNGTKELDPDEILGRVNQELEGKYLGSVERRNILLVRQGSLKDKLRADFRKIDSVEIEKKFPGALLVKVHERKTVLMLTGSPKSYAVDDNGIAYEEVSVEMLESNPQSYIILKDTSEKPIEMNETTLEKAYVAYLEGIRENMKRDLGIEVKNNFETPSLVSDDVRVQSQEGWQILFNPKISLRKELEMLNVFLDNKLEKNRRPDLEYVDLRSDNKIFYKFKDGTQEDSDGAASESDENQTEKNKSEVKGDSDKKGKKKKK